MLKTLLQRRNADSDQVSIEDYNKEIDEVLAEAEKGNYITQDQMEEKASKR